MTTTQVPPTARQLEIRDWVKEYIGTNGYSPSLRELCAAFGFRSPNGAICHLMPLRRKGLLTWVDGKPRTLRITEGCDLGL